MAYNELIKKASLLNSSDKTDDEHKIMLGIILGMALEVEFLKKENEKIKTLIDFESYNNLVP